MLWGKWGELADRKKKYKGWLQGRPATKAEYGDVGKTWGLKANV